MDLEIILPILGLVNVAGYVFGRLEDKLDIVVYESVFPGDAGIDQMVTIFGNTLGLPMAPGYMIAQYVNRKYSIN